jgi:hypothetical protein
MSPLMVNATATVRDAIEPIWPTTDEREQIYEVLDGYSNSISPQL